MIRKISRSSAIVSPGRRLDKIEDAMMGRPKPISFEQSIRVSDEIAVGEKEQFDQFIHRLFAATSGGGAVLETSDAIDEAIRSAMLT